jgi:hypothetical protein
LLDGNGRPIDKVDANTPMDDAVVISWSTDSEVDFNNVGLVKYL